MIKTFKHYIYIQDLPRLFYQKGGALMANTWQTIALVLVIVGGLNWGLVGLANFNLVDTIFGAGSTLATIVYALVGVSAVYAAFFAFKK